MELLPTLLSPTSMILIISSYLEFIINNNMQLKGKQIKDYILGDTIVSFQNMHLLGAATIRGQEVSVIMIDKSQI